MLSTVLTDFEDLLLDAGYNIEHLEIAKDRDGVAHISANVAIPTAASAESESEEQ